MSIRFAIIYMSLFLVLGTMVLFLSGPLWGLRLDYEKGQQLQLIQLIIPVFLSYLSAAVTYAISGTTLPEPVGEKGKILRVLTLGAFITFGLGLVVATAMYYVSANGTLEYGRLAFDKYSAIITMLLGILAATTSAISVFIFAAKK